MTQSLYIAGADPLSGKSIIVLGMMQFLTRTYGRVGFFRPIVRTTAADDAMIHLVTERFGPGLEREEMAACTQEEALDLIGEDRYDELLKRILNKYKAIEGKCDVVLCAGTDYTGVTTPMEFDFNADAANNLGSQVITVVNGRRRTADQVADVAVGVLESLEDRTCDVLCLIVNRVDPERFEDVESELKRLVRARIPIFCLPETVTLGKPTVGQIARALNARCVKGDETDFDRDVLHNKAAAMQLPNFLDHVEEGSLIIAPADRSEIILGSILAHKSSAYPHLAGMVLTGDLEIAPQVMRLVDGLGSSAIPMCSVESDTYETAVRVEGVIPVIEPGCERKVAAALGLMDRHVDFDRIAERIEVGRPTRVTPLMFEYTLIEWARSSRRHIVLPEGDEDRILRAAETLLLRGAVDITLLGDPNVIREKSKSAGLSVDGVDIIDPSSSDLREKFAEEYYNLRKHKGISRQMAYDAMSDVTYFGTMMVRLDEADGLVSGAVHPTQDTLLPAFRIIGVQEGVSLASSVFFMCLRDRVLVFGDCAVNPDPNAEQLAEIAIQSAGTAETFGVEPLIAMLSYSSGESGKGADVDKVRKAVGLARDIRPDLVIDGPIQYDAAVDMETARIKMPESPVAGRATVFIFPDLNNGNITYKAVQRSSGAVAIGPVMQGLRKPVNDLSRGATVTDIVNTIAITAIQAQSMVHRA